MKRYGMLAVIILAGLAAVWPLFAQEAERGPRGGDRERRGRGRWMSAEDQQKAFATIEEQLGKMKAGMEGMPRGREGWRVARCCNCRYYRGHISRTAEGKRA